jgi:hypothetical protein
MHRYKPLIKIRSATLTTLLALTPILGCAPAKNGSQHRSPSNKSSDPRLPNKTGSSLLRSQVVDPVGLGSVNGIKIDRPVLSSNAKLTRFSLIDAHQIVQRIASETMTLKIVEAGGVGEGGEAVLKTEILRLDERQGSSFGGEPAVVSFKMRLESSTKARLLWSAQYFLRQEAVSENLLRLGERVGPGGLGAGWVSAREVFESGVIESLVDLNSKREGLFLVR